MSTIFAVLLLLSALAIMVYAVAVVVDSARRERDSLGVMLAAVLVTIGAASAALISFARVPGSSVPAVIGAAGAVAFTTAWVGLPT